MKIEQSQILMIPQYINPWQGYSLSVCAVWTFSRHVRWQCPPVCPGVPLCSEAVEVPRRSLPAVGETPVARLAGTVGTRS